MPHNNRRSRSRSRNRDPRSRNRHSHSRDRVSRSKHTRRRDRRSNNVLTEQMQQILDRLTSLEGPSGPSSSRQREPGAGASSMTPPRPQATETGAVGPEDPERHEQAVSTSPGRSASAATERDFNATDRIVEAIRSINTTVRSNHSYYISNFDPSINDMDTWSDEVDRAKILNHWSDNECLSRIGNCLKGDARTWLNEWVTHDRSWSNFKKEFKPLCPRNPDVANILYEVMSTNSDKYPTYADYARRSLLRLRIVKGLSDELISAIVIRGITDPQIRASATNSKLKPNDLVEFLSIYIKSNTSVLTKKFGNTSRNDRFSNSNRDIAARKRKFADGKCFLCGQHGHRQSNCAKRSKTVPKGDNSGENIQKNDRVNNPNKSEPCSFCKKPGHKIESCFAKIKSESRNTNNVNFCRENPNSKNKDIAVAVIQGVPVDVLIDSGSCISLISSSLLKHFKCVCKPAFKVLRGIGGQEVESTHYVTLPIEFNEITLEVDLHVVPPESMNTPIIVGTDVLNREGVTYTRTRDEQHLTYESRFTHDVNCTLSSTQIPIETSLTGQDLQKLLDLIDEFSKFLITGTATSTVSSGSMSIKLNSSTTVTYRPYRLSYPEILKVREIIRELLEKKIIRESESEYASPILLVKKKDGSDRMCVDYRKLNEITIKDRFPLPLIDDHIDRLGKHKFFTSLDMATGFHQIPMDDDSIRFTAFVTPEGHYEYLKMPYGLANAPIVYQRIMSKTLREHLESGKTLVYIDDVLILSDTVDEGLITLRKVLQTLTESGFSINLKKCSFLSTKVEYLGRTISQGQVQPSVQKVKALVESPVPKNVKQVRQFLGLASYFRRYIAGFASKTAPIAKLTKKGVTFSWGSEQEEARQNIISHLTSEPVLAIYDPDLPIEVHTDASSIGYGAVLLQVHEKGHKRAVGYFSKRTQGAEPKYHSYELETLAVVKALQHFRHYLVGVQFKVVTDCNALKSTQQKKDLLPRVARWWIYMQDFNFTLEYRKGTSMSHADYLSRNPVNVCEARKQQNWAQIAQGADEETQQLIQKLTDRQLDSTHYVHRNGLLFYKYSPIGEESRLLCFVPKGHRLSLLRIFHDEHDHLGVDKTLELIRKHFWFPSLKSFVQKYVAHCLICITHKKIPRAPNQPIHSWEKPDNPFEVIHVDALGPLPQSNGYRYVLIAIDAFSKYCLLYPMYGQDANELKRLITNVISLFGTPKQIIADRGRMFLSSEFTKLVTELGIDIHLITPEMHRSNGQVERYCRTLLNMVRIECNHRQNEWSDAMWRLQLVLNITKQKTIGLSPLNLLVGIEAATPLIRHLVRDIALENSHPNREALRVMHRQRASERLRMNQRQQDKTVNADRRPPRTFDTNSLVFVIKQAQATGKLDSGMRGPYRVVKALPHGRYELQLLAGSYGKSTQAAAEFMVPWRGEWTPDTCAAFFEGEGLVRKHMYDMLTSSLCCTGVENT